MHAIFSRSSCHSVCVGCACFVAHNIVPKCGHLTSFSDKNSILFLTPVFSKHAFLKMVLADSSLCNLVAHLFGTFAILTAYFW